MRQKRELDYDDDEEALYSRTAHTSTRASAARARLMGQRVRALCNIHTSFPPTNIAQHHQQQYSLLPHKTVASNASSAKSSIAPRIATNSSIITNMYIQRDSTCNIVTCATHEHELRHHQQQVAIMRTQRHKRRQQQQRQVYITTLMRQCGSRGLILVSLIALLFVAGARATGDTGSSHTSVVSASESSAAAQVDIGRRSDEQKSGAPVASVVAQLSEADKRQQQHKSIVASLSSAVASAAAAAAVAAAQSGFAAHNGIGDARSSASASGRAQHAAASQQAHHHHQSRSNTSPQIALKIMTDSIPEVPYHILHNMKKIDHAAPFYNSPHKMIGVGKELGVAAPLAAVGASGSSSAASNLLMAALTSAANALASSSGISTGAASSSLLSSSKPFNSYLREQIKDALIKSPFAKRLVDASGDFASEFRSFFNKATAAASSSSSVHHTPTKHSAAGAAATSGATGRLLRDISVPALLMLLASSAMSSSGTPVSMILSSNDLSRTATRV